MADQLHTVADGLSSVADDIYPQRRATAPGTYRRLAAIGGGAIAVAVITALLISVIHSPGSRRIVAAGRSASPAPGPSSPGPSSPAQSSPAQSSPAGAATKPPVRKTPAQPAIVPVAHTSASTPLARTSTPLTAFTALAGPGCPSSAKAGIAIDSTWYAQPGGGWMEDGCSGMFYAKWVHQPGDAIVRTFTWWFHTGLSGSATCKVSVYVPDGSAVTAGANPAPYMVYSGSSQVGSFSLDQLDNQGEWLYAGAYPSAGGRFSVQVENVGSGSVEVAADAVSVSCTV